MRRHSILNFGRCAACTLKQEEEEIFVDDVAEGKSGKFVAGYLRKNILRHGLPRLFLDTD